ncbi:hypothetical protein pneo_cds_820 [Pandoravirus neocaledonia]|uniref:Uncharacterized protein n=1 Tax=Pandoravirus neocaledonia TaxID=2107708 RepID=A0A2U7UDC3_9VIRU|nr:hypothetical protein pneo_cds_820 [Pandoravirus neocaledonia]AVK76427.1 hypothetical protein pneo_cds_820 [Pandoravirus neocaledonia]
MESPRLPGDCLMVSESIHMLAKEDDSACLLPRLFRDHPIEASLVISHLSACDIVHVALASRAVGLAMPRCMLCAAELGLLSWHNLSITRRRVCDVPFTWPLPLSPPSGGEPSPFTSWDEAYALEDLAATAHDGISRLVRWTAAVKSAAAYACEGAKSYIDFVGAVDADYTSKGDPNWWLDEPEHRRVAEKEERADDAVKHIKASVREYSTKLAVAARTQSHADIARRLCADTATIIDQAASKTWFAGDYMRNHVESDTDAEDLLCGLGPALRTGARQDFAQMFFAGTVDHVVRSLINRRPPPGATAHGERTVCAVLTLVERWCPHNAFADRANDLQYHAAISPDGPEHDAMDTWMVPDAKGITHTVLKNTLRAHLRKRIGAYAPYLCQGLLRLCVCVSIIERAGRMHDRAVVTAAASLFTGDMEPRAIARSLDEALSQDAIARRAFGDRIDHDALTKARAQRAVATNASVIVMLLVRSLEAVSLLVATFPDAPLVACQLAERLFCVAEAITTRIVWAPRRSVDPCFVVDKGRIRLRPNTATHWTLSLRDTRLYMRRANRSTIRALFGATNVDAWARVVAQPKRHPARRLLIAGEGLDQPCSSPMAQTTHMIMRAIQDSADRTDNDIHKDADCARRVVLAFGRALGTPDKALAVCHALVVLYDLPPMPLESGRGGLAALSPSC